MQIKQYGLDATTWKSFIPATTIPDDFRLPVKYSDQIERIDNLGPSDECHYRAAFNFRYLKLKRFAMDLWKHYVYTQKEQRRREDEKTTRAIRFYEQRNLALAFTSWQEKATEQKKRKKQAKIKIAKIWCMKLAKVYISGWRNFTIKQLDTRKYFEKLERGEIHEEKFNKLLGNKDADVIYNLPRKIAIKIFSYLNIEDLSKCREVSREWSIIVQSPSLWGRLDYSVCRHKIDDVGAYFHSCISKLHLSHLNLAGSFGPECKLTQASVRAFSQCRNIQFLNLSRNQFYSVDESVKMFLIDLPNLLMLDLSYTSISDASLRAVGTYCTNLQILKCSGLA